MTGIQLAILAGGVIAAGVLLGVRALRPAPPSLGAALALLTAAPSHEPMLLATATERDTWLPPRITNTFVNKVGVPAADLAVLSWSREQLIARKLMLAAAGLLAPATLSVALLVVGLGAFAGFPLFVGVALAGVGWMLPTLETKEKAAAARAEFRTNLEFFLTLVAGERRSRGSVEQALDEAVEVSGSRPFVLMRRAIRRAALAGRKPWADLRSLGEDMDVPELRNLADIAEVAADGAAVYNTLLATARTLRHAELSNARAEANQVSERMSRPLGLLVFGLTLFVLIPFMLRMFGLGT